MSQRIAVKLATSLGSILPEKAWRLIWKSLLNNRKLMESHGWGYLSEMADRLNIDRIGVMGDYGIFNSSPRDGVILKEYALKKKWAGPTNDLIKSFFSSRRGTYFDIGANIGMTVVPLAASSEVRCFAFEPEPTNFANLNSNIRENCIDGDVTTYQIALFDRKATLTFELSSNNLGDHRIRISEDPQGEAPRQTIQVQCARLDDMELPVQSPFFVKIDTQGAEPFIIAGGASTLAKSDMILMEWSPYLMRRMKSDPKIVIDFLRANFSRGAINASPTDELFKPSFTLISETCDRLVESLTSFTGIQYVDILARK